MIGPQTLAGLAKWLRAAAREGKPVTISPETARILADAADAQSNAMMEGRAA
jgi:hypothetical protein